MPPSFDLDALTQQISEILSVILYHGVTVPGTGGLRLPFWFLLVLGVVIVVLVANPFRKEH